MPFGIVYRREITCYEFLHVIYISVDQPSDFFFLPGFSTDRRSNNLSTIRPTASSTVKPRSANVMSPGNGFSKMLHCSVLAE